MTTMNTRLQQFLAAENLTQAQFAESINVAAAGISHILAGRNKPGYDFLLNTMKRYPSLDIEWLMTGKGKMYKNTSGNESHQVIQHAQTPATTAPQSTAPAPQQKQDELPFQNEDDEVDLFNDTINGYSVPSPAKDENIKTSSGIKTIDNNTQRPVKQRKAVKIIIFFDDNTFQEF